MPDNSILNDLTQIADRTPKPSKKAAQALVMELAEKHPDSVHTLASLYTFFMPAKTKTPKNVFEWVAQATAAPKEEPRKYLHFVYCDGERIMATNGNMLFIAAKDCDKRAPGFYDPRNGVYLHDKDWSHYPQVDRVIPSHASHHKVNFGDMRLGDWGGEAAYIHKHDGLEYAYPKAQVEAAIWNEVANAVLWLPNNETVAMSNVMRIDHFRGTAVITAYKSKK